MHQKWKACYRKVRRIQSASLVSSRHPTHRPSHQIPGAWNGSHLALSPHTIVASLVSSLSPINALSFALISRRPCTLHLSHKNIPSYPVTCLNILRHNKLSADHSTLFISQLRALSLTQAIFCLVHSNTNCLLYHLLSWQHRSIPSCGFRSLLHCHNLAMAEPEIITATNALGGSKHFSQPWYM